MEPKFYKKQNVANFCIKPILLITVCVLLVYSSCRKDTTQTPSSPNNAAVSGQIAVNLSKSLAGNFGGLNLNDGVDSISFQQHSGPQHACTCMNSNPLCGFYTDSLVNYTNKIIDTTWHTGGNLKFYFNCVNGKLSGYSAYDSLTTVKTTPQSVSTYNVQQWYTIQALDDQHQFIGVSGTNDYKSSVVYTGKSGAPEVGGAFYELTDLKINVVTKDILSGTATFKAYGPTWNVTGTITFLGNHMADMTMNGQTYHVNLLTGKLS